jgi:hypothetical protein
MGQAMDHKEQFFDEPVCSSQARWSIGTLELGQSDNWLSKDDFYYGLAKRSGYYTLACRSKS